MKIKRLVSGIAAAIGAGCILTACGAGDTARSILNGGIDALEEHLEAQEEEKNEQYRRILEDKAEDYGIDPDDVEISQGGGYFKVPVDTITSYEQLDDMVILKRKWLRFAYAELDGQYFVGFFDSKEPELMYGGFSNQDLGYTSEYYWNDADIHESFASKLRQYATDGDKYSDISAEDFYELTGIDEDMAEDFVDRHYDTYPRGKEVTPDKDDHTYAFIPGDTIEHLEKFTVGDDDCPIDEGFYMVDLPSPEGLIHITDENGKTKYRLDASYRDGHSDELYEYSPVPAVVELEDGDIIYMPNRISTFDVID